MASDCVFCDIAAQKYWVNATYLTSWSDAVAIEPLNPVTPGHVLVIPRAHAIDAMDDPMITASAMGRAAEFAQKWTGGTPVPGERGRGCNIITSCGAVATQTVFHLHIHIVPRRPGDGAAAALVKATRDARNPGGGLMLTLTVFTAAALAIAWLVLDRDAWRDRCLLAEAHAAPPEPANVEPRPVAALPPADGPPIVEARALPPESSADLETLAELDCADGWLLPDAPCPWGGEEPPRPADALDLPTEAVRTVEQPAAIEIVPESPEAVRPGRRLSAGDPLGHPNHTEPGQVARALAATAARQSDPWRIVKPSALSGLWDTFIRSFWPGTIDHARSN